MVSKSPGVPWAPRCDETDYGHVFTSRPLSAASDDCRRGLAYPWPPPPATKAYRLMPQNLGYRLPRTRTAILWPRLVGCVAGPHSDQRFRRLWNLARPPRVASMPVSPPSHEAINIPSPQAAKPRTWEELEARATQMTESLRRVGSTCAAIDPDHDSFSQICLLSLLPSFRFKDIVLPLTYRGARGFFAVIAAAGP